MKDKTKYKSGDVLEIPKKYLSDIITTDQKIASYDNLIDELSTKLHQTRTDFWDFLLTIFPGIDKYDCSYDRVNKTVIIKKVTKDKLNIFHWMRMCKEIEKLVKKFEEKV